LFCNLPDSNITMKKFHFILLFFLLFGNILSQAQRLSVNDSVFWYLKQFKGVNTVDSLLLEKTVAAIYRVPKDSLPYDRIESEIKKLYPFLEKKDYFALKTAVGIVLTTNMDFDLAIDYNKRLIQELMNYSDQFTKNLLLFILAELRLPYRNSNRIQEGIGYYQRLVSSFEQENDSNAISICYYTLSGFYRNLGLKDKSIYCLMKSSVFLNRDRIFKVNDILIPKFTLIGTYGYIHRKALLGYYLIDNDEPEKALPFLYEAKSTFESKKDSIISSQAPFINLQIIRAKILTGSDSVFYYFSQMKKYMDTQNDPNNFAAYYQTLGYYCYLRDRLDSAVHLIRRSAAIKDSCKLPYNSIRAYLIPGYYLALIRIREHKYGEAISLLKDEYKELIRINLRKVALKEMQLLSDAYEKKGDLKNSKASLDQYIKLQNEIIKDENSNRSLSFETEQQILSLNAEKQMQQKEISRQKFIRNLIIGGLALMIIFSVIFLVQRIRISKEKKRSEGLLLNILPAKVAEELKVTGHCQAKTFSLVTVMFMDFKDFTSVSEKVSAELLVDEINFCFSAFDSIIQKYKVEKIKTVGDSYICVGGLPVLNYTHASDIVNAGLEIRDFMLMHKKEKEGRDEIPFELRIGIHTGPVVAGIVGVKKFQYDIWGDTVNLAARMESSGEAGKVNISGTTYALVKDKFACIHRGKIQAKNKGEIDMYFVENTF
jgi:class 3 adenylate cyclase